MRADIHIMPWVGVSEYEVWWARGAPYQHLRPVKAQRVNKQGMAKTNLAPAALGVLMDLLGGNTRSTSSGSCATQARRPSGIWCHHGLVGLAQE